MKKILILTLSLALYKYTVAQGFEWIYSGVSNTDISIQKSKFINNSVYVSGATFAEYISYNDSVIYAPDSLKYSDARTFIFRQDTNGIIQSILFFDSFVTGWEIAFDVNDKGEIGIFFRAFNKIVLMNEQGKIIQQKEIHSSGRPKINDLKFDSKNNIIIGGHVSVTETDNYQINYEDSIVNNIDVTQSIFLAKYSDNLRFEWFSMGTGKFSISEITNIATVGEEIVFNGPYYSFPSEGINSGLIFASDTIYSLPRIDHNGGLDTTYLDDVFVGRIDKTGQPLWILSEGDSLKNRPKNILVNQSNIYSGLTLSINTSYEDAAAIKQYDLSGNVLNTITLKSDEYTKQVYLGDFSINSEGSIAIGGDYSGSIIYQDSTICPLGNRAFLMILNQNKQVTATFFSNDFTSNHNSAWFESIQFLANDIISFGQYKYYLNPGSINIGEYELERTIQECFFSGRFSMNFKTSDKSNIILDVIRNKPNIYPNPVTHRFLSIDSANPSLMEIMNLGGKLVFQKPINTDNQKINIPNSIQPGIYIIRIKSENPSEILTKKLIIE